MRRTTAGFSRGGLFRDLWRRSNESNPEVRRRVEATCRTRGYAPPMLCTPQELMGAEAGEKDA